MVALRDPIRDTITAATFVTGVAIGLAVLLAASEVDFEASPLRRAVFAPLGARAARSATCCSSFGSGPGHERRQGEPVRRSAGRSDPVAGRVRARRVLRAAAGAAARAVGAGDAVAALAARHPPAALEGRPAGGRQHGARARVLLPPEGPGPGAGAVVRGARAVCALRAGGRRSSSPASPCSLAGFARRLLDRASGDRRPACDDLAESLEQRRARAATRSRTGCGRWRPAPSGAAALASAARSRFRRAIPTSSSPRSAKSSGSSGVAVGRRALRDPELAMPARRAARAGRLHGAAGDWRRAGAGRAGVGHRRAACSGSCRWPEW